MYLFRIWFKAEREAIARELMEPNRRRLLAEFPKHPDIVQESHERGVRMAEHNMHPLTLLHLRPKVDLYLRPVIKGRQLWT